MIHVPIAFLLLLHVLSWGAGAAMLAMPRPWRRFWPVLVVPAGLALQSAVVWGAARAGWRGTDVYAWWSQLLPLALLGAALWRHGRRAAVTDLSRFGVVWAAMAGSLLLLVLPMALASPGLTSISLGSCDAADYAAGARVLKEFSRADRGGFLGLVEVVGVLSVDSFPEYWLRLNHFTPSALVALNGSVFAREPHELVSLMTAVYLAGAVPGVFWAGRAILGYSGGVSVLIAALFGVSPIMWYAVAHAAPGQLLAAQAVVPLTWAGIALWRGRWTWRRGWQFAWVLAAGYWLVLGSYNFFVFLCLVPAAAYAIGSAVWQRSGWRLARWGALMLGPLVGCAVLFWGRVAGLVERIALLQTFDFGWKVPPLTAEGWLGMVQGPDLAAWSILGARWVLSAAVLGLLAWAAWRALRQRSRQVWVAAAIAAPVLAGYVFLQMRGARFGTNASYDAYKLFAVFYPVLLPALCWWVTLRRSRRLHEWVLVVAVAGMIGAFNLVACGMFGWKMSRPPLLVDRELPRLREIEAMPDVKAVNLLIPDMWSRLWANAFLLRKAQYFETHTYEARRNTPLRGEWDLEGGLTSVVTGDGTRRPVSPRFTLVDARDARHLRMSLGEGWHALEHLEGNAERWQWTGQEAVIVIENPQAGARPVSLALEMRAHGAREVILQAEDGTTAAPGGRIGEERRRLSFGPWTIPAGRSRWVLRTPEPALPAGPADPRLIALCVYRLTLTAGGN